VGGRGDWSPDQKEKGVYRETSAGGGESDVAPNEGKEEGRLLALFRKKGKKKKRQWHKELREGGIAADSPKRRSPGRTRSRMADRGSPLEYLPLRRKKGNERPKAVFGK